MLGPLVLWPGTRREDYDDVLLYWTLGILYFIYLCHIGCGVKLSAALYNTTEGVEEVCELADRPRHENPHFSWHVQCYHYVTRTTGSGKNRRTRRERVNTHRASHSGVLPSTDQTPSFVPNTQAQQTQLDTFLELDLTSSNYLSEYSRWCMFHRRDVHQDKSRNEDLPSRRSSILAVWIKGSQPCYMHSCCYWLANLLLLSFFYRLFVQSKLAIQHYTYKKKCFNIH